MPKITIDPSGAILEVPKKANLLATLLEQGIPVGSACGGHGLCASCKVTVLDGIKNLSRPNECEKELSARNNLADNERIACQCKITGDLRLTTSYWGQDTVASKKEEL